MNDKTTPAPNADETPEPQDALTVLPVASILMMVELLEVLKEELPQVQEKLSARLQLLKAREIGKNHPKSIALFESVLQEGSGA